MSYKNLTLSLLLVFITMLTCASSALAALPDGDELKKESVLILSLDGAKANDATVAYLMTTLKETLQADGYRIDQRFGEYTYSDALSLAKGCANEEACNEAVCELSQTTQMIYGGVDGEDNYTLVWFSAKLGKVSTAKRVVVSKPDAKLLIRSFIVGDEKANQELEATLQKNILLLKLESENSDYNESIEIFSQALRQEFKEIGYGVTRNEMNYGLSEAELMVGCSDSNESCVRKVLNYTNTDEMVFGTVKDGIADVTWYGKTGTRRKIQMPWINADSVLESARVLVDGNQGLLNIYSTDIGAKIIIDDKDVGYIPEDKIFKINLEKGTHSLRVTKAGYRNFGPVNLEISDNNLTTYRVSLIVKEVHPKNKKLRVAGYSTLGAGAAVLTAGLVFYARGHYHWQKGISENDFDLKSDPKYHIYNTPGSIFGRRLKVSGTDNKSSMLEEHKKFLNKYYITGAVLVSVGSVLTATGATLLAVGYAVDFSERKEEASLVPHFDAHIAPGGGGAILSWTF